jgi:hypothetical protein
MALRAGGMFPSRGSQELPERGHDTESIPASIAGIAPCRSEASRLTQECSHVRGWSPRSSATSCPHTAVPPYFALSFACSLRYKGNKGSDRSWTVPCTPPGEVEGQP